MIHPRSPRWREWSYLVLAIAICLVVALSLLGRMIDSPGRAYERWFYEQKSQTWKEARWLGVEIEKNPMDLQIYQEILSETKPDILIEAGTYKGGSAYFFASIFDLLGHGRVVTIDIDDRPGKPRHPRIDYILGSSTDPRTLSQVRALVRPGERVMVILDSDHHRAHVLREMELYGPLVTPGNYLVVEDTNMDRDRLYPNFGPGPGAAVAEFLKTSRDFLPDPSRERYQFTFNPGGWLRRVEAPRAAR